MRYYDEVFVNDLVTRDLRRLINQVYKLLPMREHGEDWQKQLNSVLVELRGLHKMFGGELNFLIIITKLEGLVETDDFMIYRGTVFSVMSLMTELTNTINARES